MSALARPNPFAARWIPQIFFALGIVLLLGTWTVLYWSESLFTESHLVGYYCCVTELDLPAPGTLERMASDFFRTSPGIYLPPLSFVAANVGLFALSLSYVRRGKCWWLPFLFAALNILYLLLDFWLIGVSWFISDRLVGLRTSAYKGYHRAWYGIVLHVVLWLGFYVVLSRVPMKLKSESQAIDDWQA